MDHRVLFRSRESQKSRSSLEILSVSLTNENRVSTSMSRSSSSWSTRAAASRISSSISRLCSRAAAAAEIWSWVSFLRDPPGPPVAGITELLGAELRSRIRLTIFVARLATLAILRFSAADPSLSSAARSRRSSVDTTRSARASHRLGSKQNATAGSLSSLLRSTRRGRTYLITNFRDPAFSCLAATVFNPSRIGLASRSRTPRARLSPPALFLPPSREAHSVNVALILSLYAAAASRPMYGAPSK
mmetsp:Transcript_8890/g.13996  ORF Transcript_8890/g.13996 Transcript_8890/m.13996 type:complete len:246 (-) Transcript_8890:4625-5362(-)